MSTRARRRLALDRLAAIVFIAWLLSACSSIQLTYNNADEIAVWMADDYFDLSREQKDGLRLLVQRFHAWHRTSQLPEYARLLDAADQRLATGLGAADVAWMTERVEERYRIVAERACADAARALATLSDEQVKALGRKFEETNRKWSKENGAGAPAEEEKRLRLKWLQERIEHWTGDLDARQSAKLAELNDAMPLISQASLRYRLRRQREFLALLQGRNDVERFIAGLRGFLLAWDRAHAPEYEGRYAGYAEARSRLYVQGFQALNGEQRAHVAERIRHYSRAFRQLAERAPRASPLAASP